MRSNIGVEYVLENTRMALSHNQILWQLDKYCSSCSAGDVWPSLGAEEKKGQNVMVPLGVQPVHYNNIHTTQEH